jgi:serine/threonine protein kinase
MFQQVRGVTRMALSEGQMLGPYKIVAQLGSGGMATIYKAYHARLDRYVAVKVMHQAFLQDEGFLARFEREAQIVARLEHPNIVPVYDFAEVDGQPYLVMKFIEGRTLKQINDKGGMTLDEMLRVLPPLADALDYAHRRGVLHRDIKPSNILLDNDGTPYITDFGLARLAQLGESTLSADILLGTPHYISPEQAMGRKDLNAQTDLYSLGVVLYEMVVGRVPYSADTPFAVVHDHIYKPLPLPSSLNPDVTPAIEAVLIRALAKDPADRYENAKALVNAFTHAVGDSGLTTLNPDRARVAADAASQAGKALPDTEPAPDDSFDPFESALLADEIERENSAGMDGQTVYMDTPPGVKPASKPDAGKPIGRSNLNITFEDGKLKASLKSGEFDKSWQANIPASWMSGANTGDKSSPAQADTSKEWEEKTKNDIAKALEVAAGTLGDAAANWADDHSGKDDYGDDPVSMRKRAEYQVKKRNEFIGHAASYGIVITIMWIIYGFTTGFLGDGPWSLPWPAIVMFAWGAGLAAHGVETYFETGKRAAVRVRAVQDGYRQTFGANWRRQDRKALRKVRRVVEKPFTKRREFYQHLAVYVPINIMLWMIYAFSNDFLGDGPWSFPWPLIVMLGWGIGLVANGVETFGANRQEKAIANAMAKERELLYGDSVVQGKSKRKNDHVSLDEIADDEYDSPVRLTGDGELTESMVTERDEADQQQRAGKR